MLKGRPYDPARGLEKEEQEFEDEEGKKWKVL